MSLSLSPSGLNLACNYSGMLGVLSLPPISQEGGGAGVLGLRGEWPASLFPTIHTSPWFYGPEEALRGRGDGGGWKRKRCLDWSVAQVIVWGRSPPLPGQRPEAQQRKQASSKFPLSVPSQGWVEGPFRVPAPSPASGGGQQRSCRPASKEW